MIIAPFVRKVLAIHPDDQVSNQEMLATMFSISFTLLLFVLIGRSFLALGFWKKIFEQWMITDFSDWLMWWWIDHVYHHHHISPCARQVFRPDAINWGWSDYRSFSMLRSQVERPDLHRKDVENAMIDVIDVNKIWHCSLRLNALPDWCCRSRQLILVLSPL